MKAKTVAQHYHIDKKDLLFLAGLICITLLLGELPFIAGNLVSNENTLFTGAAQQAPGDYFIYSNFIDQSRRGALLFKNFFTSEPHNGLYFSPFWMVLGKIAALTSLSIATIFELAKLFFGAIAVSALFLFIKRIFTNRKLVYAASITTIFSGGISLFFSFYTNWIVENISENQDIFYPIDFFVSEAFVSSLIAHSGLFSLSFTLFITTAWLFLSKKQSFIRTFLLVFLPFVLGIIHTYDIITLCLTLGIFTGYMWLTKKPIKEYIKKLSFIIIGAGPAVIYLLLLFSYDPIIRGWIKQNVVEMPLLFPTLIGLGLLLPLTLFAGIKAFQRKNTYLILLFIWATVALLLSFSPISFSRKLLHGLSFPMGILTAASLYYFFEATKKITNKNTAYALQGAILIGSAVLLFLSRAYDITYNTYYYSQGEFPYFISKNIAESYSYLQINTNTHDVILAPPPHSKLLPGLYFRKNFLADEHQTIDYKRKREEYLQFTQFIHNNAWKKEFLEKNAISYFLYDKNQKHPNDIDFYSLDFLERTYENDDIVIFKVK